MGDRQAAVTSWAAYVCECSCGVVLVYELEHANHRSPNCDGMAVDGVRGVARLDNVVVSVAG